MNKKDKQIWLVIGVTLALAFLINFGYIGNLFAIYYSPSCDFITNVENSGYVEGTWVSVDSNGDGKLEGFGYSASTSRTYRPTEFLAFTSEGFGVYKSSTSTSVIYVTQFVVTDKNVNQAGSGKTYISSLGTSAETSCQSAPSTECTSGESMCNSKQLIVCGTDGLWKSANPLEIGICGVECISDSDCDNFQTCSDNSCSFDQSNLNAWLLSQNDLTTISMSELASRIDSLDLSISQQADLISSLQTQLGLSVNELSDLINGLQTQANAQGQLISNLKLSLDEKAVLIADLQTSIEGQAQILSQLQITSSQLADLVSDLQTSIAAQGQLISDLDESIQDKAAVINNLEITVDQQADLIGAMELSVSDLITLVSELQGNVDELKAELNVTQSDIESLKLQLNASSSIDTSDTGYNINDGNIDTSDTSSSLSEFIQNNKLWLIIGGVVLILAILLLPRK